MPEKTFEKFDELTQGEAEKLACPFKVEWCKGRWCAAWRFHNNSIKGYCKLIEK